MFESVTARHVVPVAPAHLGDLPAGVRAHLQRWLLRYAPELGGVPLAYSRWELACTDDAGAACSAPIVDENPCPLLSVRVHWTLFVPQPGMRVSGSVVVAGPEHVAALVLGRFPATVRAANMAASARWDAGLESWVLRATSEAVAPGAVIDFEIVDVSVAGEILSLEGSLDRLL